MNKKPLVLLHGALGTGQQFDNWKNTLAEYFEIYIFDFEGHGLTAPGPRPYRIEHFAENLDVYLNSMDLPNCDVFGYSMGGYAAMYLAAQKPGLISRIFTLGTKFDWTPEYASKESRFLDPAIMQEKVPAFAETLHQRHGDAWKEVLTKTAEMMQDLGTHPRLAPDQFAALQIPIRIGIGDRDNTVTVEEATNISKQLPQGELMVFAETPHPIERVKLELVLPAFLEFFVGK